MTEEREVRRGDISAPLSYYTPDFLSSLCIMAKSIENPYALPFTSQHAEKTKRFYDLLGELPTENTTGLALDLKEGGGMF